MSEWGSFAVIAGSVAGALTGLLFVSVSIRIEVIGRSADLRNRAAQTLTLFMSVVLIAVLLSVPAQSTRVLGLELLLLAVVIGGGLFILDRRAQSATNEQPLSHVLDVISPNKVTSVLIAAAGLLLLFTVDDGVYVLVPAVIVALVGGTASAWLFLTKTID